MLAWNRACLPPAFFPDVPANSWYVTSGMLDYAARNGLMAGYSDGRFGPEDPLTRGQVAVILWRYAGEDTTAPSSGFIDVSQDQYYWQALNWARQQGVFKGDANEATGQPLNTVRPDANITREELAVVLHRYATELAGDTSQPLDTNFNATVDNKSVSAWAKSALIWATYHGILSGSVAANGTAWLLPNDSATRAQMAKMITVLTRDVLE
jgi:hypothetical protein